MLQLDGVNVFDVHSLLCEIPFLLARESIVSTVDEAFSTTLLRLIVMQVCPVSAQAP